MIMSCGGLKIIGGLFVLVVFGVLAIANPADAESAFVYRMVHPTYGDIGTFSESVMPTSTGTVIQINVHIAVKFLGITLFREEGERVETFKGNMLASLKSYTVTNGSRIDVTGEAQEDAFILNTPSGLVTAPLDVFPSDPWLIKNDGMGTSVAIETGEAIKTQITGGEQEIRSVQGALISTRHFKAVGADQQYDVWVNDSGVPVAFRSLEDGTPIDFTLISSIQNPSFPMPHKGPIAQLKSN